MERSLFWRLFAGVAREEMAVFPLVPLGFWMLPAGIYLLLFSLHVGRNRQSRRFAVLRYGMAEKWWQHHFCGNLLWGGFLAAALLLLGEMADLFLTGRLWGRPEEAAAAAVLWTVHMCTLAALFLFLEVLRIGKMIPPILLLSEGLTFLGGYYRKEATHYMYGFWGMYVQSSLADPKYGFPASGVLAAELVVIAGCCVSGRYILKTKEIEGVS